MKLKAGITDDRRRLVIGILFIPVGSFLTGWGYTALGAGVATVSKPASVIFIVFLNALLSLNFFLLEFTGEGEPDVDLELGGQILPRTGDVPVQEENMEPEDPEAHGRHRRH